MKRKIDRIYVENPGFRCELKVVSETPEDILIQLAVENPTPHKLYLWRLKLPAISLSEECVHVQDLGSELNLIYKGTVLKRNQEISKKDVIELNPGQKFIFTCNLSKYFNFERQKIYQAIFNTWMPLIDDTHAQVFKQLDNDDAVLPVFFLIESEWTKFST